MWYLAKNGQQQGPVSEEQLRRMIQEGSLKKDDSVWQEGMAAWQPAESVAGLAFPTRPSVPTPPPLPPQALASSYAPPQYQAPPAPYPSRAAREAIMQPAEILKTLEFAPVERKLEVLGKLNTGGVGQPLEEEVRSALEKIVFGSNDKGPVRFFATRALLVHGDNSDRAVHALASFMGCQLFEDRNDKMIYFPWAPLDSLFRLRANASYAAIEGLSLARGNREAAVALRGMLDVFSDPEVRALVIFSMGSLGHEASREVLEYYGSSMADSPEGKAATICLKNFGQASVYDLMRAQAQQEAQEKKGACFVVTAVCGDDQAMEVQVCRAFRDRVLIKMAVGRSCIELYNKIGPKVAGILAVHPILRKVIRMSMISPIAAFLGCFVLAEEHGAEGGQRE